LPGIRKVNLSQPLFHWEKRFVQTYPILIGFEPFFLEKIRKKIYSFRDGYLVQEHSVLIEVLPKTE